MAIYCPNCESNDTTLTHVETDVFGDTTHYYECYECDCGWEAVPSVPNEPLAFWLVGEPE